MAAMNVDTNLQRTDIRPGNTEIIIIAGGDYSRPPSNIGSGKFAYNSLSLSSSRCHSISSPGLHQVLMSSMDRVEVIHDQNLIIPVYAGHIAEITHYLLGEVLKWPGLRTR